MLYHWMDWKTLLLMRVLLVGLTGVAVWLLCLGLEWCRKKWLHHCKELRLAK